MSSAHEPRPIRSVKIPNRASLKIAQCKAEQIKAEQIHAMPRLGLQVRPV